MLVTLTPEGARRLQVNTQTIQAGSPQAPVIQADIGPEIVDAAIALGLCLPPAGWQPQYR
jgi:hypothetical protein